MPIQAVIGIALVFVKAVFKKPRFTLNGKVLESETRLSSISKCYLWWNKGISDIHSPINGKNPPNSPHRNGGEFRVITHLKDVGDGTGQNRPCSKVGGLERTVPSMGKPHDTTFWGGSFFFHVTLSIWSCICHFESLWVYLQKNGNLSITWILQTVEALGKAWGCSLLIGSSPTVVKEMRTRMPCNEP